MAKRFALALLILPVTACGDQTTATGPGGVSDEDAKALDEAAEKLETDTTIPQQQ